MIAVILGAYISNITGKPLQKLSRAADTLSKGDVDMSSILEGKDYELKKTQGRDRQSGNGVQSPNRENNNSG